VQGTHKGDINSPPMTGFTRQGGSPLDGVAPLQPAPLHQASSDESVAAFFEHLKRSMEEEEVYDEFLKVLEMFSLEILDADSLLERLTPFLSLDEMNHLLDLLGWDDDKVLDERGGETDSFERRRALASLKQGSNMEPVTRVGPSYRSCPVVVRNFTSTVNWSR
jgi:histone deacetylase complex regulatory component SIN3